MLRSARARAVGWLLGATVLGLFEGLRFFLAHRMGGLGVPLGSVLARSVLAWLPWAAYGPLILALGRRWPLEVGSCRRHLAPHLLACLVLALVQRPLVVALAWMPFWPDQKGLAILLDWAIFSVHHELLLYGAVAGIQVVHRQHSASLRAARLERELTGARLESLTARLQPHFFFNALHSVRALIGRGRNREAREALTTLADLMRTVLRDPVPEEWTLREELEFCGDYLDLERIRFGDRLEVQREVSPEALDALVPRLALQALVENAVQHAVAEEIGACPVWIRGSVEGEQLLVLVEDAGPGPGPASRVGEERGNGRALADLQRRLAVLHGDGASFGLEARSPRGSRARLELPLRMEVGEWVVEDV